MSAPPKRPSSAPHEWVREDPRLSRWYFLDRGLRGEPHLVEGRGPVTGYTRTCDRCGIVQVVGRLFEGEGAAQTWREVVFTGFDFDSLTPLRTPPCEVLVRPGSTAEDLIGLVDVRQLALDLRSGAA
jgi:hypothetical protein